MYFHESNQWTCVAAWPLYDKSDKFVNFVGVVAQSLQRQVQDGNCLSNYYMILHNGSFHGPPDQLTDLKRPTPSVKVQRAAQEAGLDFIFRRLLSPQCNPTEYVFSSIKRAVRRHRQHLWPRYKSPFMICNRMQLLTLLNIACAFPKKNTIMLWPKWRFKATIQSTRTVFPEMGFHYPICAEHCILTSIFAIECLASTSG